MNSLISCIREGDNFPVLTRVDVLQVLDEVSDELLQAEQQLPALNELRAGTKSVVDCATKFRPPNKPYFDSDGIEEKNVPYLSSVDTPVMSYRNRREERKPWDSTVIAETETKIFEKEIPTRGNDLNEQILHDGKQQQYRSCSKKCSEMQSAKLPAGNERAHFSDIHVYHHPEQAVLYTAEAKKEELFEQKSSSSTISLCPSAKKNIILENDCGSNSLPNTSVNLICPNNPYCAGNKDGYEISRSSIGSVIQKMVSSHKLANQNDHMNKTSTSMKISHRVGEKSFEPPQTHGLDGKYEYACHVCSYQTDRKQDHEKHLRIHEPEKIKRYYCPLCDYMSKRKGNLKTHLRTHEPDRDKLISCRQCDFRTDFRGSLVRHLRTHEHDGLKHHSCPQCKYKSDHKGDLTVHLRTHEHDRLEDHSCPLCEYKSDRKSSITVHLRTHEPDRIKLHSCPLCKYKSDYKKDLNKHLRNHEPNK